MESSQSNGRTCVFCGAGGKLDQEHVMPDWVTDELPDLGKGKHVRLRAGEERKEWRGKQHSSTAGVLCNKCNTTWVSDQETPTKKLLRPIMHGKRKTFKPSECKQLALWAFTRALIEGARMPLVTREPYSYLYTKRRVPPRTKIWFGRFQLGPYQHYSAIVPLKIGGPPVEGESGNGFLAAFSIGHAVFHVFCNMSGKASPHNYRGQLARSLTQIFPVWGSLSWPPELVLDEATLDAIVTSYGPTDIDLGT